VGVVSSCVFYKFRKNLVSYLLTSETLWSELQAIAADEGLRLYDIERYGAGALRVYVESNSPEQKTSSQDCTKLCRRLMSFFLVEGGRLGVGTEPEIEVSSPGVNRHLRLPEHFKNALGERIKVGVRGELAVVGEENPEPVKIGGILGKLESVSDKEVLVSDERTKKNWQVPFDQIARANVEFKFS
jgi:ribosome maturation factor RimP